MVEVITMISCIIVAGGKSERFGRDKKFIKFREKTFLENVIEKAHEFSDEIILSLGEDEEVQDVHEKEGLKIVFDHEKSKGPLVGIYSSLKHCRGEYVVVTSVDSPLIKPEIFQEMIQECQQYDAVIPVKKDGRHEVLHAVYKTSKLREACQKAIENKEYKVRNMTRFLGNIKLVDIAEFQKYDPELLTFFNVNTREDLDMLNKLSKEG